jgi:hypothetical protein
VAKAKEKYSHLAHLVNLLFLTGFVVLPGWWCLTSVALQPQAVEMILFAVFLLTVVIVADWYHFYFSNAYRSLAIALVAGIGLAGLALLLGGLLGNSSFFQLLSLDPQVWGGTGEFFKLYVFGLGIFCSALLSLPRLFCIKLVTRDELPVFRHR